jgi:hypothetical protein
MYGVVEVMVCLCGFHNNEIRAKLASEAAEPADFTSESAETRRFSFLQAQFSRRFRSQRSQPLSCWRGRRPQPGDEHQDALNINRDIATPAIRNVYLPWLTTPSADLDQLLAQAGQRRRLRRMHLRFTTVLALALGLYTATSLLLGQGRPAA